jgi:hypothetical protein
LKYDKAVCAMCALVCSVRPFMRLRANPTRVAFDTFEGSW